MDKPTTATEAVNHGAPEAARIDHMLHHLDDLLPETAEVKRRPRRIRQHVEEALLQARSVMDMVLGAYGRVLFPEVSWIHQYQPTLVSHHGNGQQGNDVQAKGGGG